MEAGLKLIAGRPLLNSASGEAARLDPVLRLARRYGAAVIGLCMDEQGIPPTAEGRVGVAERILRRAHELGLRTEDVLLDPLTLTIAAEPERSRETLRAIRLIKERLGAQCVLGVSNVSFGLPGREVVTAAFLAMAVEAGLDAVIANPYSETVMRILDAAWLIAGRDVGARRWLARSGGHQPLADKGRLHGSGQGTHTDSAEGSGDAEGAEGAKGAKGTREAEGAKGEKLHAEEGAAEGALVLRELRQAVVNGVGDAVVSLVTQALDAGHRPTEVLEQGLIPGMAEVGARFKDGRFYLPHVLLAAETMHRALERLKPAMGGAPPRGPTVVLATVEGDVHDIGKNIVRTILESHGYRVEDLGKSVPAHVVVARALQGDVGAVGLSALMTTTMPRLGEVVARLREAGSRVPVLVGGAVVSGEYAKKIGALYCEDALRAVEVLGELAKKTEGEG